MSNTEAGLALKYMKDDTGEPDEFGDTDKKEKVTNLIKWLLEWYKNSPPSVEYIEKLLIIPKQSTQKINTKSKDLNFWKNVYCSEYEDCSNIF